MKVILLAGGLGTRIREYTASMPKPMIQVGGHPLLWHVMSIYASHGFTDFIVACGYKGEVIKDYFSSLRMKRTDFTVDLGSGAVRVIHADCPDWRVSVVDTGQETSTGGRVRRLRSLIQNEPFMVTYGDGVGNVDIGAVVAFHRSHGKHATVTAVRPPARFGALEVDGGRVKRFSEKPQSEAGWINGGFFVFEPAIFDYLTSDSVALEHEPLELLSVEGQLMAYQHTGYWQPMDSVRDHKTLEKLWEGGRAPWKSW